jgi:hypothetical protein
LWFVLFAAAAIWVAAVKSFLLGCGGGSYGGGGG